MSPDSSRTSSPDRKKRSPFSMEVVLEKLARPTELEHTPATKILTAQLKRIGVYTEAQHADLDTVGKAVSMARQFFAVPLYQRIAEQAMFGPKPHERSESVEETKRLIPQLDAKLEEVADKIEAHTAASGYVKITRFDNGWMYLTQGPRFETAYRLYLAPHLLYLPLAFYELARFTSPRTTYQMKTFAAGGLRAEDVMRSDKIIMYASKESFPDLLAAVERLVRERPDAFKGKSPPGGGTYSPAEGVSIAIEAPKVEGVKKTGTEKMRDALKAAFDTQGARNLRKILQSFKGDKVAFRKSVVAELLWKSLAMSGNTVDQPRVHHWGLNKDAPYSSSEPITSTDKVISLCFYRGLYEEWTDALLEDRPVDEERTRTQILRLLEKESFPEKAQAIKRFRTEKNLYYIGFVAPKVRAEEATQEAGLAVSIAKRLTHKQPIEESLQAYIRAAAA